MVNCRVVLSEPALYTGQKAIGFQLPHQTGVDHLFHQLTEAAGQSYWAIVGRVGRILSRLSYWDDQGFPPGGRKAPCGPDMVVD